MPRSVIYVVGSVWITGTANDKLYRVDPTTNRIVAIIELRERPRALAGGEGAVWVFYEGDGTVQRIDGKSGQAAPPRLTPPIHPQRGCSPSPIPRAVLPTISCTSAEFAG